MPLEDAPIDDPFVKDSSADRDDILDRSFQRSRNVVELDSVESEAVSEPSATVEHPQTPAERRKYVKRRLIGGAVVLAATAGVIHGGIAAGEAVTEQLSGPEVSEEMVPVTVQPGEGLWHLAESIPGSENIDINTIIDLIESDPRNSGITSQPLNPGEIVYVPASIGDTAEEE